MDYNIIKTLEIVCVALHVIEIFILIYSFYIIIIIHGNSYRLPSNIERL